MRAPVPIVPVDEPITNVLRAMHSSGVKYVLVAYPEGGEYGLVSFRSIAMLMLRDPELVHVTEACEIAEKPVMTISYDASVFDAIVLMARHDVGFLPVLRGCEIAGSLFERDGVRAISENLGLRSRVKELMVKNPPLVRPESTVADALRTLCEHRAVKGLLVADHEGSVRGVVTLKQVLQFLGRNVSTKRLAKALSLPVRYIEARDFIAVHPDVIGTVAAELMIKYETPAIVVMDGDKLMGLVCERNLLKRAAGILAPLLK